MGCVVQEARPVTDVVVDRLRGRIANGVRGVDREGLGAYGSGGEVVAAGDRSSAGGEARTSVRAAVVGSHTLIEHVRGCRGSQDGDLRRLLVYFVGTDRSRRRAVPGVVALLARAGEGGSGLGAGGHTGGKREIRRRIRVKPGAAVAGGAGDADIVGVPQAVRRTANDRGRGRVACGGCWRDHLA